MSNYISFAEEVEISRRLASCFTFEISCDLPMEEFREKCNIAYRHSQSTQQFVTGVIDVDTFLDMTEDFAGTAVMDAFLEEVDCNLIDAGFVFF